MGLAPAYKITADGSDITEKIAGRLVSIRITDEAGIQSDTLEITIRGDGVDIPDPGAELAAFIGYDSKAIEMGRFCVDSVDVSGPPEVMTIRAKAAQQAESKSGAQMLQTQKTRSWEAGITFGDMVRKIANEHGLEPAVADVYAAVKLPHVDQTNESDMNLLTRLAKDLDAIAKPASGRLVIAKRGSAKTASGGTMPTARININQVSSWRLSISKRDKAGTVIAAWHNLETAKQDEITVGEGDPVVRLKQVYPDPAAARAAAVAEFDRSQRGDAKVSITLPGDPTLTAEQPAELVGFRPGLAGDWFITRAEHTIDGGGYKTAISLEKKGP